jgi:serine/threonine protein kinase
MSKKFCLIPERIETIKNMTNNGIDSIIDFANSNKFEYTSASDDIRDLLPKRYMDLEVAINCLGGKLSYIKSGSTGHTFKGMHLLKESNNSNDDLIEDPDKEPYAIKIVAYPRKENYGDMYNIKRPENTELLMIKLLSQFVIKKQTPHIVLPITTFNTSIKPFLNLTKANIVNNHKFDQFIKKYENGDYYQNVSILVSEWANGGDLLDYIKTNYKSMKLKEWKTVIFQILSVLAIIHTLYPTFRHNDMKANNILIHYINIDKNNKKFLYNINNKKYEIPDIGYQIKLWDFDFSCIPGVVDNSKVSAEWTNKINILPIQNRYYDIHYFFNTLTRKGFFPELFTAPEVPTKIKEFVNRILPKKFREGQFIAERGRILVNEEYMIADDILKNDPLFESFRIK